VCMGLFQLPPGIPQKTPQSSFWLSGTPLFTLLSDLAWSWEVIGTGRVAGCGTLGKGASVEHHGWRSVLFLLPYLYLVHGSIPS